MTSDLADDPSAETRLPESTVDPELPEEHHHLVVEPASEIVIPPPPEDEPVQLRTVYRFAVVASLGLLTVAAAVLLAYNVRGVLVQILIAAFIAVSLDPAVRWLNRHGMRRRYAVAFIFLLFLAIVGVLAWLGLPPLLRQAANLTTDFPGYLDSLRQRSATLRNLEARFNLRPQLDHFAATFLQQIQGDALRFGQRFLGAVVSALLVLVLTIYFMADMPRLRMGVVRLFPRRQRPNAALVVNVLVDKVGAYMIGNILISVIAGAAAFGVLAALKVPFALPLAFFVALTDLIPLIGATLGAVVCTIVAFATTDLWPNTILVAAFFVMYQQLENYLIAPRVLRNTVDIPAVAVLLAALIGGSVLGLVGALIAIPLAAALKVILTPVIRARDVEEAPSPLLAP